MAQTYTSASWSVKPGEESDFIAAWKDFVGWGAELPGAGEFRLLQDLDRPGEFTSFGEWENLQAQEAWMQQPGFAGRLGLVRSHCSEFRPTSYELVAIVS